MIDDLARWHKLDRAVTPAALPIGFAPKGHYPTGQLGITHGHKPHECSAWPLSFGYKRKSGLVRCCVVMAKSGPKGIVRYRGFPATCSTHSAVHYKIGLLCIRNRSVLNDG